MKGRRIEAGREGERGLGRETNGWELTESNGTYSYML